MGWHHALHVLAIALLGCGQGKRPPAASSADTVENQAILTKLHGYIDCLGDHSSRVFRVADVYRERVGGNPPTAETNVRLQASADPKECLEAISAAQALPPRLPELDAAGVAYGKAVADVFALTAAGHGYYDRGSETYDLAKGLALHPELVAAFDAFDEAQGTLFDQVYLLNRTVHIDQLARREKKDGRKLVTISDAVMVEAEGLVRFAATPWDQLDQLDLPALTLQLGGLENVLEKMTAYALDHEEETDAFEGFQTLVAHANAYVIAAKQLVHRARGNVAYTDADKIMIGANNEAGVPGTPAAMVKTYNRLAEAW